MSRFDLPRLEDIDQETLHRAEQDYIASLGHPPLTYDQRRDALRRHIRKQLQDPELLTDQEFVCLLRIECRGHDHCLDDLAHHHPEALDRIERLLSANAELLEADSVRQSWCDSNLDFMSEEDKAQMIDELRTGKRRER